MLNPFQVRHPKQAALARYDAASQPSPGFPSKEAQSSRRRLQDGCGVLVASLKALSLSQISAGLAKPAEIWTISAFGTTG